MIYLDILKIISFFKQLSQINRIKFLFRYVSLIFTSFFYVLGNPAHSIGKKIFIVACLTVASIILTYLYAKNQGITSNIIMLVFIETAGNTLLLIPSGGINSPYVWYSLNTILVVSVELGIAYVCINLFSYFFAAAGITYMIPNNSNPGFMELIKGESNLVLSLMLITMAIYLLSKYVKQIESERKKLSEANMQLYSANAKIKESISYLMELYEAMHFFSTQNSTSELLRLIVRYTKKITKTETVLFYPLSKNESQTVMETDNRIKEIEENLRIELNRIWNNMLDPQIPIILDIQRKRFMTVLVKSSYMTYGLLVVELMPETDVNNDKEYIEQLKLLSKLSSIALEKAELEQINERLVIGEEQNRIANEIHDSIVQRLFSISCGIFALIRSQKKISTEYMEEELNIIRSSIDSIMRDLRSAIYGLSWKKEGNDNFIIDVRSRIDEIGRMSSTDINFDSTGDSSLLSSLQKKALYRIICEGVGNAVRHGKASRIDVSLDIQSTTTLLRINDDGSGFDPGTIRTEKKEGLGLKNIYRLAYTLDGKIHIKSEPGKGTRIEIVLPNNSFTLREEVV